jgi:integrase
MATIRPILKSKRETSTIYIRFRNGANHDYTLKTDFIINAKYWNKNANRPKPTVEENKILKNDLDALCSEIQKKVNEISLVGLEPSKQWLENVYNNFVNKESKEQNADISYWLRYVIDNPQKFENSIREMGLSKNRIKQYNTLLNIYKLFQGKHNYKIVEIDQLFYDNFFFWLKNNECYGHNTAKKYADDILAIGKHARRFKIPVSSELTFIDRVKERTVKPIVVEEIEIEQIANIELTKPYLLNARKWFLLGLELAQRVSDLLPLTENNIHYISNLENELVKCFVLLQKKSHETKEIIIPIDEAIENIIKDGFPTKISSQRFNEYMKEIGKIAKIDTPKSGEIATIIILRGKKVTRKKEGVFPKYKFLTSHTMRKTATTHYHFIFGSQVRHITGHSKEETVNRYVNDDRSRKLSKVQQMRKEFQSIKAQKNKVELPSLKIIKNISNK